MPTGYSGHPLQAQAPFNLSAMACHSLERTLPVGEFNLIAGVHVLCITTEFACFLANCYY